MNVIRAVMFGLLAVALVAVPAAIFNAGFKAGETTAQRQALAEQLVAEQEHSSRLQQLTDIANQTLARAAEAAQRAEAGAQQLQEQFDAYVKANPQPDCKLPAAFGVVWNAANAQGHPGTAGKPADYSNAGLPAAAAAENRATKRDAEKSSRGDRAVPELRRQAARAGGVDQRAVGD